MREPQKITPLRKQGRGVYKLQHGGRVYYRLGNGAENARSILGRELVVNPQTITILDGGEKQ